MCVERKETCGECGGREKGRIKLMWFVGQANRDGVKTEKCVVVWEPRATVGVKRDKMGICVRKGNEHGGE